MRAYHVVDEAGEEALAGEVGVVLLQVGSLRARAPSTEESAKQDSKMSLAFFFLPASTGRCSSDSDHLLRPRQAILRRRQPVSVTSIQSMLLSAQ